MLLVRIAMSAQKPLHIFFDAEGTLYQVRKGKTSEDFWDNGEKTVKRAMEYFELDPGAPALLQALKKQGHRLHILSRNVENVLHPLVSHFDVRRYFDSVVIKNDKAKYLIEFKNREGLRKEHIVMVGDTWNLDVVPVGRRGFRALLLDRDSKSDAPNRISDIREVLQLSDGTGER
ncbi:MAG: HAD family hydrolase [Thermoplasmata archaeon]